MSFSGIQIQETAEDDVMPEAHCFLWYFLNTMTFVTINHAAIKIKGGFIWQQVTNHKHNEGDPSHHQFPSIFLCFSPLNWQALWRLILMQEAILTQQRVSVNVSVA